MTDPTGMTIRELSKAFRDRTLTPSAVTTAHLERIERLNGTLNAYLAIDGVGALEAAAAATARFAAGQPLGPLDGVPVGVKDNIDVAGMATTAGIEALRTNMATEDAPAVARLRAAGAVILGKLNMHEAALGTTTDNVAYGRCHNPWRIGFSPGGSSGGSGAAVAAGLCTAALGTDTLGSVRIPASYCGVYGLKGSFGLVSTRGTVPLSPRFDSIGPLARSLDDLALMMAALAGSDPKSPESLWPPQIIDFAALPAPGAFTLGALDFPGAEAAIAKLQGNGVRIEPRTLATYPFGQVRRATLIVVEVDAALIHGDGITANPGGYSDQFKRLAGYGAKLGALDLARAEREIAEAAAMVRRAFAGVDALVLPTTPQASFAFAEKPPVTPADFTTLANILGAPALSLPMGLSADGLPLGFQLIARPGEDAKLLAIAAVIDRVLQGYRPPPEL